MKSAGGGEPLRPDAQPCAPFLAKAHSGRTELVLRPNSFPAKAANPAARALRSTGPRLAAVVSAMAIAGRAGQRIRPCVGPYASDNAQGVIGGIVGYASLSIVMNRALNVSLALLGATPLANANDLNLLGCWRSQNADQYYSDGKVRHLNSDCVSEISSKQIRTECQYASGRVNILSTYEITAPGRFVSTRSEGSPGAKAQSRVEYSVDSEWLTLTGFPQKRGDAQLQAPDKVVSLAVRVNAPSGKDVCHPRGPSKIRVGETPVSSLLLTVPEAYVPVLKDPSSPSTDPRLQQAINANFLIGQFVPAGSEKGMGGRNADPGGRLRPGGRRL